MTEYKINNNKQKSISERARLKIKFEESLDFVNENNNNAKNIELSNDIYTKKFNKIKDTSQSLKNSVTFSKAQTKSRELDKRYDRIGNLITHRGKQKISFLDRISKNNLAEIIKIDNYKEYNKMEEIAPTNGNGCCFII